MKKLSIFLMLAVLLSGCDKTGTGNGGNDGNDDGQDLSPTMQAAYNVLKDAGDMPDVPDSGEGLIILDDTSETIDYGICDM